MRHLLLFLLLIPLLAVLSPSPAAASPFGTLIAGPIGAWVLFASALAALIIFASTCRRLSRYLDEKTHASRVARLMDVLASQADGIAEMLLSHPPAATDTLQTVRAAAIAQSVAYAKLQLAGTIGQVGASDDVLAMRLGNFVSQKTLNATPEAPVIASNDVVVGVTGDARIEVASQPVALATA